MSKLFIGKDGFNYEVEHCGLCQCDIIVCPICDNSTCNGCGCEYCNEDFKVFNSNLTGRYEGIHPEINFKGFF